MTFEEQILTPILELYFNAPLELLLQKNSIKERIATIRNMQIIIYPNDHNPPHFHVVSKDKTVNAKFTLNDCKFISGSISNKDLQRVELFYSDVKTQIVMEKIWGKYHK
jgi:hypothetical protein